ncbi:uncharacterized protein LOC105177930 isoform X2 [Sesamum indicum]|uniref:Uncharacterized protein LOC105177930 isoform X2 n=1 Tax=Sesamum indicum TaxID=4182 RepID=A0A8M8VDV2_SESIN|nr:uncharacterized protein LOC105177930 isoform X2 [Sesamum indicum]
MGREAEDEADERREAAIASVAALRPNFKPKSRLTEAQLSKFQELHRRRLQIKAKSKVHKRDKGKLQKTAIEGRSKSQKMAIEDRNNEDQEPSKPIEDASSVPMPNNRVAETSSMEEGRVAGNSAAKKRQKLYWGLDTKERWERKSNM